LEQCGDTLPAVGNVKEKKKSRGVLLIGHETEGRWAMPGATA